MKKYILFTVVVSLLTFSSCDFLDDLDDYPEAEIEYTSTYPVSGEYNTYFVHEVYGDLNDATNINIYNTAADDGQEVWIFDNGNFWDFKVKCPVNMDDLTFGSADTLMDEQWGVKVVVRNGLIIKDASKQPSGVMVDSIHFEVWIEDVAPWFNANYGIAMGDSDYLLVDGFRRTGFLEDEL